MDTKRHRPTSHILAIIYFCLMVLACSVSAIALFKHGHIGYLLQGALVILAIVALSGLGTQSRWARVYCSVLMVLPSAWSLLVVGLVLFRVDQVNYLSLLPMFVLSVLLLLLAYRFAFGQPSREAFTGAAARAAGPESN